MNKTIFTLAALASCSLLAQTARADGMIGMENETAEAAPEAAAQPAGEAGNAASMPATRGAARLTASLADEQSQAQKRQATVKVEVTGMRLVDPASAGRQPRVGEGHLSYKLDDGPLIDTTATTLSFRDLDSGSHDITVMLSGNDQQPLGPSETLQVTIP